MTIADDARKLDVFTIGDLRGMGYQPGQVRAFLRSQCREVGARKGSNGKMVSVYMMRVIVSVECRDGVA